MNPTATNGRAQRQFPPGIEITNKRDFLLIECPELPEDLQHLRHLTRFVVYEIGSTQPLTKEDAGPRGNRKRIAVECQSKEPIAKCHSRYWMSFSDAVTTAARLNAHVAFVFSENAFIPDDVLAEYTLPPEIARAAERGWKLFPLRTATKDDPFIAWRYGERPATSDLNQIKKWGVNLPRCNWGIATGSGSRFFVIDIDSFDGYLWFIEQSGGILPITYTVKSGNPDPARKQYYFSLPSGMKIKCTTPKKRIATGVDVKAGGGMVLSPPSIHPKPPHNPYRVEVDAEIAEPPQWLIDALRAKGLIVDALSPEVEKPVTVPTSPLTSDSAQRGQNYLIKNCKTFPDVPEGDRNNQLNALSFLAGQLSGAGCFDRDYAEAVVLHYAADYIADDGGSRAKTTFNSGFNAGLAKPWAPQGLSPENAGFGQSPLPAGASHTPITGAGARVPALTVPSGAPSAMTPNDFWAHLPTHSYVNRRTLALIPVDAVNGHLKRFTDGLGMKPSLWLDQFRAVQQMSWHPGHPEIIEGKIDVDGLLREDPKGRIYNRYRPSDAVASDGDLTQWLNHIEMLYPDDAEHIIKWCAYRIQNPAKKINHALVLGGKHGIGKDLMLNPLRYGVGLGNFEDIEYANLFDDYTDWAERTLLIIGEARDSGRIDRYEFHQRTKNLIAAPPNTISCRKMYLARYYVPNVMAVVITSNNKLNGLYIDPDDRRHYVAWSNAEKEPAEYYDRLGAWFEEGGNQAVLGYLQRLDLQGWNAMAPPPKTEAWHQIVAAGRNPEEMALSDALEGVQVATVKEIMTQRS